MRKGKKFCALGLGIGLPAGAMAVGLGVPAANAGTVVNFHYAHNYASGGPAYNDIVYVGQGAYSDPGNNVWNGYGPGFTADTGPNMTSSGAGTPVTFTLGPNQGANGGIWEVGNGTTNPDQGTPFFLLGYASLVNSGNLGIGTSTPTGSFTLSHVPAGTYNVYLYGANFDSDRGAQFSLSSGTPDLGMSATFNDNNNNTFVEGQNYVVFDNVTPDGSGTISGTFTTVTNPATLQTGEGDFNGLQLVSISPTPEPMSLGLISLSGVLLIRRRRN